MNTLFSDSFSHNTLDSIEINHETIECLFHLNEDDCFIKDILNISVIPRIHKKYIFKAPIIINNQLTYGYKANLMFYLTCNFEYIENNELEETKFFSKHKLFNITMILPDDYEDGKSVTVSHDVIDTSFNLVNPSTIYISNYISFILSV